VDFVTLGVHALASQEPRAIAVSYWFDADSDGEPYQVDVRFIGVRLDVKGNRGPNDSFQVVANLPRVLPDRGKAALGWRVLGKSHGRWQVTAHATATSPVADHGVSESRKHLPSATSTGSSTFAPEAEARAPGVVLGAWSALVGAGVLAALSLESVLAARRGLPVIPVLLIALFASLVGLIGAKTYYEMTHLEEKKRLISVGMTIQGFVLAAVGTFLLGAYASAPCST
jgi:phosphatidylglycerol:prolipoprotein diacylglycerol transferase